MALYRLAQAAAGATPASNSLIADTLAPSGASTSVRGVENAVFLTTAVSSRFTFMAVDANAARGAATALVPENPSDPALTGISLVNASVVASNSFSGYITRPYAIVVLPATIGTGIIWTFPRGIVFSRINGAGVGYYAASGVAYGGFINHVAVDI